MTNALGLHATQIHASMSWLPEYREEEPEEVEEGHAKAHSGLLQLATAGKVTMELREARDACRIGGQVCI